MDHRVRRRMKVAAWVAFLLLSAGILSYARGYRLPQIFRVGGPRLPAMPAVGAVIIRTTPKAATVSLDGKVVDERTPTGLGSVPVGRHRLRVEKAGYQTWEKNIEVAGGAVHAFLSVRLLPKERVPTLLRDHVSVASNAPNGRALLTIEPPLLRLHEHSGDAGVQTEIGVLRLPPLLASKVRRVAWTSDSAAGALLTKEGEDRLLALFTVDPPSLLPIPASQRFIGWYPSGAARAVMLSADGLLRAVAPRRGPVEMEIASAVRVAAIHPRGVLTARDGAPGSILALHTTVNTAVIPITPPEPPTEVAVASDRTIALTGRSSGRLFLLKPDARAWEQSTAQPTSLLWSPDGMKLAYRESPFDVFVMNVSEERSPLAANVPELVLRLSDPITYWSWFPDSQHLLVGYRDILSLVSIDPRGGHERSELLSTNRGDWTVAADRFGEVLYAVVDRDGLDSLVTLPLLLADDR